MGLLYNKKIPTISCTFSPCSLARFPPVSLPMFFFQVQSSRFQHKVHSLKKSSSAAVLVDFLLLPSTVLPELPVLTTLGDEVCWSGHSRVFESSVGLQNGRLKVPLWLGPPNLLAFCLCLCSRRHVIMLDRVVHTDAHSICEHSEGSHHLFIFISLSCLQQT